MAENRIYVLLLATIALLALSPAVNGREDGQHRNYHGGCPFDRFSTTHIDLFCFHVVVFNGDDGPSFFLSAEKVLESTYHGLIKENETFVELMPQLRVDAKISGFHILRNTHKDIPFQVRATTSILA